MKKIKNLYSLLRIASVLILVISGFSCQEEINIELNNQENQRIVVEGRLTNELRNHRIRLSRTLSYFDNQSAPPVLGAEVYIIEEGSNRRFDLTLTDDTMGYYETDMVKGSAGKEYSLIIQDGEDIYKATSYLDTVAQLDSINYYYRYESFFGFGQGYYTIRISATEPPPLGNIYMFNVFLNDTLVNNTLVETPYQSDAFFNDSYVSNVEIMAIAQEGIHSDTNTVIVEMLSISEEEYKYNTTFVQETYNNGSIFSGPPANIPSNVKSTSDGLDGLGFFGASSIVRKEMLLFKEHNDSTNNPDGGFYN
jgi:hypothetical protein